MESTVSSLRSRLSRGVIGGTTVCLFSHVFSYLPKGDDLLLQHSRSNSDAQPFSEDCRVEAVKLLDPELHVSLKSYKPGPKFFCDIANRWLL